MTAVAMAALSQYLRFIISFTSAADSHLASVNYLIEPYRLPRKSTMPVMRSARVKHVPSHLGNTVQRGKSQQLLQRMKELAVNRQPNSADAAKVVDGKAKKIPPNEKTARGGESQQDADYDENTEVELDKEDMKLARPRAVETEDEIRQNVMIASSSLPGIFVAHSALLAAAGQRRSDADPDAVRVLLTYHWFLLVFAVVLLSFWFRCMRCIRCGFLLRRCRWLYSLTD